MRDALLADLVEIDSTDITLMCDCRFVPDVSGYSSPVSLVEVTADDDFQTVWQAQLSEAAMVWPVAPETGRVLLQLCEQIRDAGCTLLCSPPEVVEVAGSKLRTSRRLAAYGLEVVPTVAITDFQSGLFSAPWVVKADDGVGCESLLRVADAGVIKRLAPGRPDYIVQPLRDGESLSLSALFTAGRGLLLSINRQLVERTAEGFRLAGCEVNVYPQKQMEFQQLVDAVAGALPDLWGYAGIDLVWTPAGAEILEINPRLTTSYAGLKNATDANVAAMVLDLAGGALAADFSPRRMKMKKIELEQQDD